MQGHTVTNSGQITKITETMQVANNITDLIGKTPLIRMNHFSRETGANLMAKLEYQNPGGSVKDRLSWAMIQKAEEEGKISKDTLIIEPTSGNTGIGLAMVCAARGYQLVVTMPESMSVERRNLIRAYGAKVELTPAEDGMNGSIARAEELQRENPNSFIPQQFKNAANAEMHRRTTAPEIWEDTGGKVDIFIAGVGTGGTLTGVGEALKQKNPDVQVVAVEPALSAVLSGGEPGKHKIMGIGAGFVPEVLNREVLDEVFAVENERAFEYARLMTQKEGVFSGISSGAIAYAAYEIGKRPENKNKNIVFITCDTGERYLSTALYAFE